LTFEGDNTRPVWSPDGKRIAFSSVRDDALTSVYVKAADGSGKAELLYSSEHLPNSGGTIPCGWAPDGKSLVVEFLDENASNLMAVFSDDAKEQVLVDTPAAEQVASLSPDGRWLAYASDEAGQAQIFVRAYPGPGGKWQISTDGGFSPRWSPDGKQLFFRWDRKLWSVQVDSGADSFRASRPRLLFDDLPPVAVDGNYDILDSERLLVVEPAGDDAEPVGVTVVVNWLDDLRRRVPN